jgi:tetratricopeptide (TPR) repeat protein
MKLLAALTIALALSAPALAQDPALTPDQAKARRELNEAAAAYRKGKFEEAQAHSERALLLDPANRTAPMFIARTIHAQYKPGDMTPENIEKAQQAITAYKKILERTPTDEEAYKAIAYLYGATKQEELLREWVLQRAADVSMANDKRAEAFVVLASKDWDCSFKITELPSIKVTTVVGNDARVSYRMPKERTQFEQAKECANRALEMANMAIALTPENESAWSYKTNTILELEKLAEMSGEVRRQRDLRRQYQEALNETMRVAKAAYSNP